MLCKGRSLVKIFVHPEVVTNLKKALYYPLLTANFIKNWLSFASSTWHSLCQECIRKFPGQINIKN